MKWIHNEKVSLAWAIIVELVVHGLFAFGALLMGGYIGEIILGKSGQAIGAWILAIFIFGAAFQAFVLGEYMREHVNAFEATAKGNGSYIRNWERIQWIVGGLEIFSLLFRIGVVIQQGNYLQAFLIGGFGGLALSYAYSQAKVIHASVNRPAEHDVMQAQNEVGRSLVNDALKFKRDMSPEQKARFADGDATAVQEVYQEKSRREDRKRRVREQQEEARNTQELARKRIDEEIQQQQKKARETAANLFKPSTWRQPQADPNFQQAQVNQADQLSQKNGHANNNGLSHKHSGYR